MTRDPLEDRAAAEEAAIALRGLSGRIAALGDVHWHSPAAGLYRASIERLSDDCEELRVRLALHIPREP